MSQREDRLRAEARARYQRNMERINRGQIQVPSNAEAIKALGQSAANPADAALAALARDLRRDGGVKEAGGLLKAEIAANRTRTNRIAAGLEETVEEDWKPAETVDEFVDRILADPDLEKSLTATQRIGLGQRLAERKREAKAAELAAAEEAKATASGDA